MSVDGTWDVTLTTPMGARPSTLTLTSAGSDLQGTMVGDRGSREIENGKIDGNAISWSVNAPQMGMLIEFTATLDGDTLSGEAALGAFGTAPFEGARA